jgi:hypothetical protein
MRISLRKREEEPEFEENDIPDRPFEDFLE